jgi:hypothetical protein
MTIAEILINFIKSGQLRADKPAFVAGMGEVWKFIPDRVYGPGILVNNITGNVLSVAEISDRVIDPQYNDWAVLR